MQKAIAAVGRENRANKIPAAKANPISPASASIETRKWAGMLIGVIVEVELDETIWSAAFHSGNCPGTTGEVQAGKHDIQCRINDQDHPKKLRPRQTQQLVVNVYRFPEPLSHPLDVKFTILA